MATARLASFWPTMWRSSSETISRGLKPAWTCRPDIPRSLRSSRLISFIGFRGSRCGWCRCRSRRRCHGLAGDRFGVEAVDVDQGAGRGQRVRAAGADADQAVLGLQHVAGAGQDQAGRSCRRPPSWPRAGADSGRCANPWRARRRRACSWPGCCSSLASSRSNRAKASAVAPAKPAITAVLAQPAHLAGVGFDHGIAEGDLAVAGDHHLAALAQRQDGGAVPGWVAGRGPTWAPR